MPERSIVSRLCAAAVAALTTATAVSACASRPNGVVISFYTPAGDANDPCKLALTNRNKTLQPEAITMGANTFLAPVADRVLVADAILSDNSATPGYANAGNNYVNVVGGYQHPAGTPYPHTSPHIKNNMPSGGSDGFKDGHVVWHKFNDLASPVVPRTDGQGKWFWW